MSLILEALRKLEREKQAAERPGFVVLPAASWGEGRSRAGLLFGLVLLCAVFGALGIGLYMGAARTARVRERVAQPTPATPRAAIDPLPPPSSAPPATPGPATAARPTLPVPPDVEQPVTAAPAVVAPSAPAVLPTTSLLAEPELVADAPEGEPLATPAAARPAAPALVLTAIGARDGRAVAVIDDRLVHEGDEYDGWRVITIGSDSVLVLYKGERRTLRFQ